MGKKSYLVGQKYKRDRQEAFEFLKDGGVFDCGEAENEAWAKWAKEQEDKDLAPKKDPVIYKAGPSTGWDTGTGITLHDASELDKVEGAGGYVMIPYEIMNVIKYMCQEIKVEWQMFLAGSKVDGENFLITGYYIPKQEVSSATVSNLDVITPAWIKENSIIAGIHSHGSMSTFYSATDVEQSNKATIQLHIVVNNRLEFTAGRRWLLPNGDYVFLPVQVRTDKEKFDVKPEGIERITKREYGFGREI